MKKHKFSTLIAGFFLSVLATPSLAGPALWFKGSITYSFPEGDPKAQQTNRNFKISQKCPQMRWVDPQTGERLISGAERYRMKDEHCESNNSVTECELSIQCDEYVTAENFPKFK